MRRKRPLYLKKWFSNLIYQSEFKTTWIKLSNSSNWKFNKGAIIHSSKRFFSIVGVRYKNSSGKISDYPFINQQEVGLLGFLVKNINGELEILVQAKIEPGNTNIIQLAPSCQATKSNLLRVHGGKAPYFANIFDENNLKIISSNLQSEQGTRFYKKRNRNVLALLNHDVRLPTTHRFLKIDDFLKLFHEDFLINTDARSVLVSSPWIRLVNRLPFTRDNAPISKDLQLSFNQETINKNYNNMKKYLLNLRKRQGLQKIIPLEKMKGWLITDKGIFPEQKQSYKIRYIKVFAKNREIQEWDQPIIDSLSVGKVDLVCGRINGILHFNFRPVCEAGLYSTAELTPTVCIEPGEKISSGKYTNTKHKIICSVHQTDEGGRFYQDVTHYRLIDLGEANLKLVGFWLNLAQVQALTLEDGWFTNESRSAISLLLYWL